MCRTPTHHKNTTASAEWSQSLLLKSFQMERLPSNYNRHRFTVVRRPTQALEPSPNGRSATNPPRSHTPRIPLSAHTNSPDNAYASAAQDELHTQPIFPARNASMLALASWSWPMGSWVMQIS